MLKSTWKLLIGLFLVVLPSLTQAWFQYCDSELPLQHPNSQYTDHGDGTVTDNQSKLMWRKCSIGENPQDCIGEPQLLNWQEAHASAAITYAGYTNWRVPNIKELMSLVERTCENPAINLTMFSIDEKDHSFSDPFTIFWASTPNYIDPYNDLNTAAIALRFSEEPFPQTYTKDTKLAVRLVRDTN